MPDRSRRKPAALVKSISIRYGGAENGETQYTYLPTYLLIPIRVSAQPECSYRLSERYHDHLVAFRFDNSVASRLGVPPRLTAGRRDD